MFSRKQLYLLHGNFTRIAMQDQIAMQILADEVQNDGGFLVRIAMQNHDLDPPAGCLVVMDRLLQDHQPVSEGDR